jgi:peptidoglycan/xylan/chitin deacetylase (PgdA/CDA1 family)
MDTPVPARILQRMFDGPGVLCITYHRVADEVLHDPDVISVRPAELGRQAAWLRERFRLLSGNDVADFIKGRLDLREPAVALTFDDAYEDNFAAGRMLMERFGIPATFFVTTGFIETGAIPPWDRIGYALRQSRASTLEIAAVGDQGPWSLAVPSYDAAMSTLMALYRGLAVELQDAFIEACERAAGIAADVPSPFMTWSQIASLREMGHTIGAHTHTHPVLASLSIEQQHLEMARSKSIIEARLKAPVRVFAYPYGKPGSTFTQETKGLARTCGFDAAFSFYGGWNRARGTDPFDVRRIKVDTDTSIAMFRTRVRTRGCVPV